jgi:transformation/transcription domain-associated protein
VAPHCSLVTNRLNPIFDPLCESRYMLETMPPSAITVRKELLMATRQLLTLETFRTGFMHQLDKLMTGNLLVGPEWTSKESLKPLAYSTLADLLHHIREQMSPEQLSAAVNVQLNNVVDNTLPLQLQTMCCKLLMNLVQALAINPNSTASVRHQLVRILQIFVAKLGSLRTVQFERVLTETKRSDKLAKQAASTTPAATAGQGAAAAAAAEVVVPSAMEVDPTAVDTNNLPPIVCTELDTQRYLLPIPTNQISVAYNDGVKDCRFLLKNIISGLKVLFWGIQQSANATAAAAGAPTAAASGAKQILTGEETVLLHQLLHHGLACFDIYAVTLDDTLRDLQTFDTKCSTDEKEAIETFANIFASLHPALFTEVFNAAMPALVKAMVRNNLLLTFPQIILSTKAVSTGFASNLLEYVNVSHR